MTGQQAQLRRRPVAGTGILVTELGFGAAPIGNLYRSITDGQASATVDAAWEGGIRYFDTAPHYGLGLSERRLGAALRGYSRDQFVISTKVGRLLMPNPSPCGSDLAADFDVPDNLTRVRDYTAAGVRRSLEQSLDRLRLDRIDIALVHDPDDHLRQAVEEAIPALCALRAEGLIGCVGIGMNHVEPLRWLIDQQYAPGVGIDVVMIAGRWTLLDRSAEPLLDQCARQGISVLSAAPFNSGLLAFDEPAAGGYFNYRAASPTILERAQIFAQTARRHGSTLPQAALRFPLRHPAVVSTVAGMQKPEEARTNARLVASGLPDSAWQALGEATPLPGHLPDGRRSPSQGNKRPTTEDT
jgi:D-threo-aldose 1-dehydrogenase